MSSDSERRVLVWNYGSNGLKQLRARCNSPSLDTRAAYVKGFSRVFCLKASGWRGGVASMCPDAEDVVTFGSVVRLTVLEKKRLDAFEGGYREEIIDVWEVLGNATIKRKAIAYVAGRRGSFYTPALSAMPSEAYLVAIRANLKAHWPEHEEHIDVKSSCSLSIRQQSWRHPGVDALETLEALAVEVDVIKKNFNWTMPAATLQFAENLKEIGITSVSDLAERLTEENLRETLRSIDSFFWDDDTFDAMRALPIQRVFVYGTLQSGLPNNYRMYDEARRTRLVDSEARTTDETFALVRAPFGSWPFGIPGRDARPDSTRGFLKGELYALSTKILEDSLDDLEGHPHFYARTRVNVQNRTSNADLGRAWTYFLVDRQQITDMCTTHPHNYPDSSPHGDWKLFWNTLLHHDDSGFEHHRDNNNSQ